MAVMEIAAKVVVMVVMVAEAEVLAATTLARAMRLH